MSAKFTTKEIQTQVIELAVFLYFDRPFWQRWWTFRSFSQINRTSKLWQECLRVAHLMMKEARGVSYVAYAEPDNRQRAKE